MGYTYEYYCVIINIVGTLLQTELIFLQLFGLLSLSMVINHEREGFPPKMTQDL